MARFLSLTFFLRLFCDMRELQRKKELQKKEIAFLFGFFRSFFEPFIPLHGILFVFALILNTCRHQGLRFLWASLLYNLHNTILV